MPVLLIHGVKAVKVEVHEGHFLMLPLQLFQAMLEAFFEVLTVHQTRDGVVPDAMLQLRFAAFTGDGGNDALLPLVTFGQMQCVDDILNAGFHQYQGVIRRLIKQYQNGGVRQGELKFPQYFQQSFALIFSVYQQGTGGLSSGFKQAR